jgi:hypothetical protein
MSRLKDLLILKEAFCTIPGINRVDIRSEFSEIGIEGQSYPGIIIVPLGSKPKNKSKFVDCFSVIQEIAIIVAVSCSSNTQAQIDVTPSGANLTGPFVWADQLEKLVTDKIMELRKTEQNTGLNLYFVEQKEPLIHNNFLVLRNIYEREIFYKL